MSAQLPTPNPCPVTINGSAYELIAFYYPDKYMPWDTRFQAPYCGNFFPCSFQVTIAGITASFHNSEAAFQCTKWWHDDAVRKQFEDAKTGDDAYHLSQQYKDSADYSYAGLGRDDAMKTVLNQKFSDPDFKQALLATGAAYLLEHRDVHGHDTYWSDGHDGKGDNMLGRTLMEIREALGGSPAPVGTYTVLDFTNAVDTCVNA